MWPASVPTARKGARISQKFAKVELVMNDREQMFREVSELLAQSERYPWKTARYLSEWLRKKRQLRITAGDLDELLLQHAGQAPRLVRYSTFPARKRLALLWGHVAQVNDYPAVAKPHLQQQVDVESLDEFERREMPQDAEWCFLSHSFADLSVVLGIHRELQRLGFQVWLAELEILKNELITARVRDGLSHARRFLIYMSAQSLGSRWVLKEALAGAVQWQLPPYVIVDGSCERLVRLFAQWRDGGWQRTTLPQLIQEIVADLPPDPVEPTPLSTLLAAALGDVPLADRGVILWPDDAVQRWNAKGCGPFSRLAEVFSA